MYIDLKFSSLDIDIFLVSDMNRTVPLLCLFQVLFFITQNRISLMSMKKETALESRHGQPIWHVYSRRKREGGLEERKRGQLEKEIMVFGGDKKKGS